MVDAPTLSWKSCHNSYWRTLASFYKVNVSTFISGILLLIALISSNLVGFNSWVSSFRINLYSQGFIDKDLQRRLRKTLYYGKNPLTDRTSLPVTELAVELLQVGDLHGHANIVLKVYFKCIRFASY